MYNSSIKTFTNSSLNYRLVPKVFFKHAPSLWLGFEQNFGFTPNTTEEIRISVIVQMLFASPVAIREKYIGVGLILH